MFEVSLEQGYSFSTMLAVAVAAVIAAAGFYRRAFGMLRRRQWCLLFGLRVAAILIIVLLLFRPVLSYHKQQTNRPSLVFLLDRSASMSISDDATGVTRFNQARRQIETWWENLQNDFELHLIEFSERSQPLDDIEQLTGLRPDGTATSLSGALAAAAKLPGEDAKPLKPRAVILLSDGMHNSARNPLDIAAKMTAPVHAVGVGASLRNDVSYRDVQLTAFDCPDRMLVDNLAKITASIEGIGLPGRVVRVVLKQDGEVIDESELTLDEIEGAQTVAFEFVPQEQGRHTYTVEVPAVEEERIAQNNRRSAVAMVVEPGIRVFYLEGTLRKEYGAIVQRFLAKDPDLEFCALVQTRPNVFSMRTNIEGLEIDAIPSDPDVINSFDVFIFGDLDASYIRSEQQQLIVRRVRAGAGLVMLGGYHSLGPGGYANTPLGQALPVFLGTREIGQETASFLPVLTPDGSQHPIFANITNFFPNRQGPAKIAGLPPLDGCTRVEGARPGATILATFSAAEGSAPVLTVAPLDRGRTAVFCGDTTRNWQQGPRALGQESPFLRFWGQTVRWLAGRDVAVEAGASITASTDKAYYEPEEPIRISAVVRDQRGEATDQARVVANLRGPTGRPDRVTLSVVPGTLSEMDTAGHYSGTYEPKTAGQYEIMPSALLDGAEVDAKKLTADSLIIEVGRPYLEFERLDLNEKLLGQIATQTGGRYVHITTADYLIEQLDRSQRQERLVLQRRLYWPPLLWTLFVGLLSVEWILRRRFQLR